MPRPLNRRRPFGIIAGEGTFGCAYEQDGSFYNAQGEPVEWGTGKRLPIDNVVVRPQVKRKEGEEGDELPEQINLRAWAAGKEKYPFHKVQKEISRIYAIFVHDKKEAIAVIEKESPVAA
jgi:hypothetical protein